MEITRLTVENLARGCVTDNRTPRFSFALKSDKNGENLESARISVNGWLCETSEQVLIPYGGAQLKPFTEYRVRVEATGSTGEKCSAETSFETGRMGMPWQAKWITDGAYVFREKRTSPRPMTFRRRICVEKQVSRVVVYATAMGIYELCINGERASDRYFAPGFTSYKHTLQYRTYDITNMLRTDGNEIMFTVAGGWAVGSFVFTRKNRITAKRQALLAEVRFEYADGTSEVIGTDESWQVTTEGNYRFADFYDGEIYDATTDLEAANWHSATEEDIRIRPRIIAEIGAPVGAHEAFEPVSCVKRGDELIYDFGQNFAGVVCAKIKGRAGQRIVFRHAEVLDSDGTLAMRLLRSAKATAEYICKDGDQCYSPVFTYMGFRYVGVSGAEETEITLTARAIYSDLENIGAFSCSDERINKLQSNIVWSAKSNFVEIPTDCPQRDERMGWTGDIALFAPAACYNFDMSRFFEKWLNDLKDEQIGTGGIPTTVPAQGYKFPATMPKMAVDFWGDACILVPWAHYLARGDKSMLETMYPVMKKYVNACRFWAGFGIGKRRYIWHTPAFLHFGDWVAPDIDKMSGWQKRSRWTATASLANSCGQLSKIAALLGKEKDAKKYAALFKKVANAYVSVFTDGKGRLKNEFQTAYVLPLAFGMFPDGQKNMAAKNLEELVKAGNYCINTGFPGTPYILSALADNGLADTAFKMLMNEKCPSWLYEVKAGGTTIWERWDAIREDGTINAGEGDGTGGMISFNHYASGAVGDFLYKYVAGIRPVSGGYKTFKIQPVPGGGITSAEGQTDTPYGKISSSWKIENDTFCLSISVPVSTHCTVVLPDGTEKIEGSGEHSFRCRL